MMQRPTGKRPMLIPDEFCQQYQDYLDGIYDCIDRIVLNAYFIFAQSPGGFRTWWRVLMGTDDNLNNTNLMRFAGRFSRRIHAYAKKEGIPLIHCQRGERKHEIAEQYIPKDPNFRGVFCILAGVAPAPLFHVQRSKRGVISNISTKTPYPYVNHYSFHIMDPEWGHLIIKLCPHPPFNAQIILNGHEYIARQARKQGLVFTKEGNCFTAVSDIAGLSHIADTMRASCSVGRLVQTCDQWIYSACLCFALDRSEQKKSSFYYSYSVYQMEYSRNLLFSRGRTLDQVFHGLIDRTRAPLNLKTVRTIFGTQRRLFSHHGKKLLPRFEIAVERPVYDLTIFKIHFGKMTIKMYSKGERVLRIEAIVHNTSQLRCGRRIERFPQVCGTLKEILERFLTVLNGVDVSFIDNGTLEKWPLPSKVGATPVGGVDINRLRTRAVMEAVIALSIHPRGFSTADLAEKVREILGLSESRYHPRQASYDLKKFRGKDLVQMIGHSRRYTASSNGLRSMTAFLVLREKILIPLLAGAENHNPNPKPQTFSTIDVHYKNIQHEMQQIFEITKLAA
jgi:hypothetical protein